MFAIFRRKGESLEEWLRGPHVDSDEYDTELEDDFPPGN